MRGIALFIGCLLVIHCGGTSAPKPLDSPPDVTLIQPIDTVVFVESGRTLQFNVSGKFFTLLPDASDLPAVSMIRTHDLSGVATNGPAATSVVPVSGQSGGQQALTVTFQADQTGAYALEVKNSTGVSRTDDVLLVMPKGGATPPSFDTICLGAGNRTFTLQGTFDTFGTLDNPLGVAQPGVGVFAVSNGDVTQPGPAVPTELQGCQTFAPFKGQPVGVCTQMILHLDNFTVLTRQHFRFQLDPGLSLLTNFFDLLIEYPASGPDQIFLEDVFVDGAPVVLPSTFPTGQIAGGDAQPALTLDGAPLSFTAANCEDGIGARKICRELDLVIPATTQPGTHTVRETSVAGCVASATFNTRPVPRILSSGPTPACVSGGANLVFTGVGFFNLSAKIDGLSVLAGTPCADGTCVSIDPSHLTPGQHSLVVTSILDTTRESPAFDFTVNPGPASVGHGLPETILAGARRQVFVPVTNKTGAVQSCALTGSDGGTAEAEVQDVDGGVFCTTPADAGPGTYAVSVRDQSPCAPLSSTSLALADSAVLASYDFADGGDNVAFAQNANIWSPTAGDPGGAVTAQALGEPQFFEVPAFLRGDDLGLLRFDLSACPFGSGEPIPASIQVIGQTFQSVDFILTHPLEPPNCGFTHYDVPLGGDGWTYNDRNGARPATFLDFVQTYSQFEIQGSFFTVGDQVTLDNVSIELGR